MGADTKALKLRIKSVDSTLHLTKAMGLVASSKIRRATDAMLKSREYSRAVEHLITTLAGCQECQKSPYMHSGNGKTALVVIAGDRGMAGGYNANVFRLAKTVDDAVHFPIGKRACDRLGEGYPSAERFSFEDARALAERLCLGFEKGEFAKVGILSTRYISMMSQEAEIHWLLPLTAPETSSPTSVTFEPDELTMLRRAVPEYVAGKLISAVRESFTSEVAARRTAMDSAGKNATEMIESLQLQYNRARQGAITQEITEIVAGSGS